MPYFCPSCATQIEVAKRRAIETCPNSSCGQEFTREELTFGDVPQSDLREMEVLKGQEERDAKKHKKQDASVIAFKVPGFVANDYHPSNGGYTQPPQLKRSSSFNGFERPKMLTAQSESQNTYIRSEKAKRHGTLFPPFRHQDLAIKLEKQKVRLQKVILANVGGFENFLADKQYSVRDPNAKPIAKDKWGGDGVLYQRMRSDATMRCTRVATALKSLGNVYVANDYPCVHIDLTDSFKAARKGATQGEIKNFHKYMGFVLNAYIDFFAHQSGYTVPCVCRSSFGYLTPTTADTVFSIRLNLGIAPTAYLDCVIAAITLFEKHVEEMFANWGTLQISTKPFFLTEEFRAYHATKGTKKKKEAQAREEDEEQDEEDQDESSALTLNNFTPQSSLLDYVSSLISSKKGYFSEVARTFGGGALGTRVAYDALTQGQNGVLAAVCAPLDNGGAQPLCEWTVTKTSAASTLSFVTPPPAYYENLADKTKPSTDAPFLATVDALFKAANMTVEERENAPKMTENERWIAALFAAEEMAFIGAAVYREHTKLPVATRKDIEFADGSDSEQEDADLGLFHLKLIAQNGMNAIGLALQLSKLWIENTTGQSLAQPHIIPGKVLKEVHGEYKERERLEKTSKRKAKKKTDRSDEDSESSSSDEDDNLAAKIIQGQDLTVEGFVPTTTAARTKLEKQTLQLTDTVGVLYQRNSKPMSQRLDTALGATKVTIYADLMYYEVPALLKINRWLKEDSKDKAQILMGDVNHCVVRVKELKERSGPNLIQNMPWGKQCQIIIADVTSAKLEVMGELVTRFSKVTKSAPPRMLILISSGLKHEQLGTDKNHYGTVRFFVDRHESKRLAELYRDVLNLPAYRQQPVVSHSMRRHFKEIGAVPTVSAILLSAREDKMEQ